MEQKLECLRGISRAEGLGLSHRYVLGRIVDKYLDLNENEQQRFSVEIERGANKGVSDMVVTWEEALAEREAKGKAEGAVGEARKDQGVRVPPGRV